MRSLDDSRDYGVLMVDGFGVVGFGTQMDGLMLAVRWV